MISVALQGRLGNQFMQIAFLLQYAKKYNLEYHIPALASHCDGNKMYFPQMITASTPSHLRDVHELQVHATPKSDGTYSYNVPEYKEWEQMDNVRFVGYWQTFKYIDWCRDYILEKFQLPYNQLTSMVGIHCRYGDFTQLRDKHPEIPADYYKRAIEFFIEKGYTHFFVCSDDLPKALEMIRGFKVSKEITITVGSNNTEIEDLTWLYNCEHQILCYSTFGFTAAWLNQNPDKIVLIPESKYCFSGAHTDFIPTYFTQLPI